MTATAPPAFLTDPTTLGDLLRVASADDYDRWQDQIRRTGGCADPVHLTGWTLTKDKATGETLHHYSTETEPGGRLRLACGNRRASRCPSCAWTYAGDTYHLIRAGLAGDDRQRHPRPRSANTRASSPPSPPPPSARSTTGPTAAGLPLRHPPRRRRPALGTAARPATTYDYAGRGAVQRPRRRPVAALHIQLRRELAARAGTHPDASSPNRPGSPTARSPNTSSAAPSTSTP